MEKVAAPRYAALVQCGGALLIGANHMDPGFLGGMQPEESQRVRQKLDEWWEIVDHDSALETMRDLLESGMRKKLNRTMELFSVYRAQGMEKGMFDEKAIKKNPSNNDKLLPRWKQYGDKTFLGWDLCRAICTSMWCYGCGYLSFEEMMELAIPAGQLLQKEFSSWDDVMESYLTGLFIWMDPKSKGEQRPFKLRCHLYRVLRSAKGPFAAIPFNTPLTMQLSERELMAGTSTQHEA